MTSVSVLKQRGVEDTPQTSYEAQQRLDCRNQAIDYIRSLLGNGVEFPIFLTDSEKKVLQKAMKKFASFPRSIKTVKIGFSDELEASLWNGIVQKLAEHFLENNWDPLMAKLVDNGLPEKYAKNPRTQEAFQDLCEYFSKTQEISLNYIQGIIYKMMVTRPEYDVNTPYSQDSRHPEYIRVLQGAQAQIQALSGVVVINDDEVHRGWLNCITTPENGAKIHGVLYKRYVTLASKDFACFQHLKKLVLELQRISKSTKDDIRIKIPNSFERFMKHADSMVIHYQKSGNKTGISETLRRFLDACGVSEAERPLGRVKFAVDPHDTSFSDLVARQVGHWASGLKPREYDSRKLAVQVISYAINLAQKEPFVI